MNSGRRIYRVLVVLTAVATLASCVPISSDLPVTSPGSSPTSSPSTPAAPGVADLLAQLKNQDAGLRLRAAYQLGELWPADEDAVKALIQAAGDPDPQVRTVVAYALGKAQAAGDQAVSALVGRLGDSNAQVRYSSARALRNIGSPAKTALPGLLDRLKGDADENVRYAAAEAIAQIGPRPDDLPVLMQALTDNNWYVRHYAGLALQQLGAKALATSSEFRHQSWDLRSRATDLLSQMGQGEIPQLVTVLMDENTDSNVQALVAVALIRMAPESTPYLKDALKQSITNDEMMNVGRAITALGYSGRAAVPALIAALTDLDSDFSDVTVTALARIGPDAIPALVDVFRNGNEQAASGAADALAKIGAPAIPYVLPLLKDEAVRLRGVQLLGRVGGTSTGDVTGLAAALEAGDAEERQAALAALHEIGGHQGEAVLALVSALQSGTPAVRSAAADSLAQFGAAARPAVPALVEALSHGDGEVRIAAARALGSVGGESQAAYAALVAASQDRGAATLRKEAIVALGGMGAQAAAALPELVMAVQDPSVSEAAITAIGNLGPAAYPAVPVLAAILKDAQALTRTLAAQALGGVGPAAAPELMAALRSEENGNVRSALASSLAKVGPSVVPALVEALGGGEPAAAGARAALGQMGEAAVPGLTAALRTADTQTRAAIVKVFHDVGPHAFAGFELALQDEDAQIQDQAVLYATEVYTHTTHSSGLAVKEAVPFLASSLVAGDPAARLEAAQALTIAGPNAADAVPALIGALQDTDQAMRLSAAEALVAIGPLAAEAVPALGNALGDSSTAVRAAAARALAAIGPQAATAAPTLVAALQHETDVEARRAMIEALAVAGPSVTGGIPALVEALRVPALRRMAAEALGSAGVDAAPFLLAIIKEPGPQTGPELAEALAGSDNDLRRSAAYALLLNTAATRNVAGDLAAALGDAEKDAYVRSMAAAALERGGQNVASFWIELRADSPLGKTCPRGKDLHLSGGPSFDIYDDGCNYAPGPTLPSIIRIFKALISLLTGRH